jgi:hypothetical protein
LTREDWTQVVPKRRKGNTTIRYLMSQKSSDLIVTLFGISLHQNMLQPKPKTAFTEMKEDVGYETLTFVDLR